MMTEIRPSIIHDLQRWTVQEIINKRISIAEMNMLKWMNGVTKKDKIRNQYIIGVALIEDKIVRLD